MNYYQYKRRAPRSRRSDYIKPFLVIIIFIGIIIAGWRLIGSLLDKGDQPLSSEKVSVEIETGGAKAMTAGEGEWMNISSNIYLYEGEGLKTQSDGRVTLQFFERDTVRMDKSTEVNFTSLSRDSAGNLATLEVKDGKLWVNVEEAGITGSEFTIKTGLLNLKSAGGTFALSYPGMLYVIKGSVQVDIMNENKLVKTATIGVGQELIVDKKMIDDLSEGLEKEVIFALDDAFKSSNWYRWNQQQGGVALPDEAVIDSEDTTDETSTKDTTPTEEKDVENVPDEAITEEEPADENDKEPPATPQIDEPGESGDSITLDDVQQIISGTVSKDTEGVIINDYRLSLYKPGSGQFSYYAKVAYGNLDVGENEYEIIAVDKAGNQSESATITLILPQEVYDKAQPDKGEASVENTASTPVASATGGVKITSPNNGENLVTSETSFEIKGDVPAEAAKVVVNDYTLSGYTAGNSTFLYRANSSIGNLEIGEINTYKVEAYDADGKLLGSATMTIDVESGASGGGVPAITMPTSSTTYETTLDQLVLGGSVGKWITRVRINGDNLNEYIPGSEEWKHTVTLTPGENSYKICGEKEGEEQGCSSITINYKN